MSEQFPASEISSDDRLWALLSYILSPIVPIIILLMEDKKNRPFLKAHYVQALVWGVLGVVVNGLLSLIIVGCFTSVAYLVITIIWAIKANKGEYVTIPVITNFVKNQGWA